MAKRKTVETTNDISNIDLSITQKQKFSIDGDKSRILEINIQDMNMPSRFYETQDELEKITKEWAEKVESWSDNDDDETNKKIAKELKEIDTLLRQKLDYIFDANISEVTAPYGSMFDFIHGKFRFEYILDVISSLYEETISKETQLMLDNMQKHTSKYTKKK